MENKDCGQPNKKIMISDSPDVSDFYFTSAGELAVVFVINSHVNDHNDLINYFDPNSGDMIRSDTLPGDYRGISKDRKYIILSIDGGLHLYDNYNKQKLYELRDTFSNPLFSHDSKYLFYILKNRLIIWNIENDTQEGEYEIPVDATMLKDISNENIVSIEYYLSQQTYNFLVFDFNTKEFIDPFPIKNDTYALEVDEENYYISEVDDSHNLIIKSISRQNITTNWIHETTKKWDYGYYSIYPFLRIHEDNLFINVFHQEKQEHFVLVINKSTGEEVDLIGPFDVQATSIEFDLGKYLVGTGHYSKGGLCVWDINENRSEKFIEIPAGGVWNMYLDRENGKVMTYQDMTCHEVDLNTYSIKKYWIGNSQISYLGNNSAFSKDGKKILLTKVGHPMFTSFSKTTIVNNTSELRDSLSGYSIELSEDGTKIFLGDINRILEVDYETLEIINEYVMPANYIGGKVNENHYFNDIDIHGDKLYGVTSDGCLVEYTLRPASVPRYISDDNSDVLVYPNPVSSGGKLSIDIKNENYTITGAELLDLTSNIIQRYETTPGGRQSISLRGIAPGVYFLKLSTNKGIIVKKLVVM
ncbi:MAG: T9SS type A sorting domain-containing protein [Candidatus Kapaibacterium sp.]